MPSTREPRELVAEIEARPSLPAGFEERFAGYGVMGLPFTSGHLLAMPRFPASSVGPGYRSVWHRAPDGRWTFFQDVPSAQGCTRYFGAAVADVVDATIDIDWTDPRDFSLAVATSDRRLDWQVGLTSSTATKLMNAVGSTLPETIWRRQAFLVGMGAVAGAC